MGSNRNYRVNNRNYKITLVLYIKCDQCIKILLPMCVHF